MTTREKVALLFGLGLTQREISREVGVAKSTVSYHVRRLGVPVRAKPVYDWATIRDFYEAGHSARACRAEFGFSGSAGPKRSSAEQSILVRARCRSRSWSAVRADGTT